MHHVFFTNLNFSPVLKPGLTTPSYLQPTPFPLSDITPILQINTPGTVRVVSKSFIKHPFEAKPPAHTLSHASSAVDANDLAIDPLAVLGRQEAHDTSDIDGKADTVERRPAGSVL